MVSISGKNKAIMKSARLAITLAAVALMTYLLWSNRHDVLKSLSEIPAWRLIVVLAIMMVSRFAVALRWHMLLRSMGVNLSVSESIRLTFAGLFASNFLPTTVGGDVVRLAGGMKLRCDKAAYAGSLVMDRVVGLAGMAVTLFVGLPMCWSFEQHRGAMNLYPVAALLSIKDRLPKWITERNIIKRLLVAFRKAWRSPKLVLAAFFFTWVHMVCLFAIIWILLDGMGHPLPFVEIGGLWGVVYCLSLLPFSINGLGLQEVSVLGVFHRVAGVPWHAAIALAILMRTIVMVASLPGAAFMHSLVPDLRDREALRDDELPTSCNEDEMSEPVQTRK